jgi:hypothetical protein
MEDIVCFIDCRLHPHAQIWVLQHPASHFTFSGSLRSAPHQTMDSISLWPINGSLFPQSFVASFAPMSTKEIYLGVQVFGRGDHFGRYGTRDLTIRFIESDLAAFA